MPHMNKAKAEKKGQGVLKVLMMVENTAPLSNATKAGLFFGYVL